MSNFNHIDYQVFQEESKTNSPIYRKLKIVNHTNNDLNNDITNFSISNQNSDSNSDSNSESNSESNNLRNINRIEDNINYTNDNDENKNYYSTNSMKTVDLNSTMPYGYNNKKENRYYDSLTNISFNDINEFNNLNKMTFDNKTQNLKFEIEDSKNILRENIQKAYERNNMLQDLEEKSDNLLDGAEKFKLQSKYLKRKMYLNYICHFVALGLGVLIIILFIRILLK